MLPVMTVPTLTSSVLIRRRQSSTPRQSGGVVSRILQLNSLIKPTTTIKFKTLQQSYIMSSDLSAIPVSQSLHIDIAHHDNIPPPEPLDLDKPIIKFPTFRELQTVLSSWSPPTHRTIHYSAIHIHINAWPTIIPRPEQMPQIERYGVMSMIYITVLSGISLGFYAGVRWIGMRIPWRRGI